MAAMSAMLGRRSMVMRRLINASLVAGWCLLCPSVAVAQLQDTVIYYHVDAIGSVRMITNANGQVLARYDFLPFGEPWGSSTNVDPRQFSGKERDAETGFDYFGARYYSSAQGRFTNPDTAEPDLTNPQTFNRYRYALNNPLHYIDRDGLYEEDVHRGLTAILALAAGFSLESANAIGAAAQFVDDDPRTDPTAPRNVFNEQMRADYHFTSEARRTAMWTSFQRSASITALGEYTHALQDSYSHQGYGAKYGHARAGKAPDKTTSDPAKADRMAAATYGQLVAARALLPVSGQAIPYKRIEELVAKFNRASQKDKPAVIDEIRREIQKERDQ
jgi:RHS repeat-associated protein